MEKWQKEHITNHLYELVKNTVCNTELLISLVTAGVLTDVEMESIACKNDRFKKSNKLYQIIQTRSGAYISLIKSLLRLGQTGVVNILKQGFPLEYITEKRVMFHRKEKILKEVLTKDTINNIYKRLKCELTVEEYIDFLENSTTHWTSFYSNTIFPEDPHYISRILTQRVSLDKSVFKLNTPDIFVFNNSDELCVESAIGHVILVNSVTQRKKITAKLIRLELKEDWEKLKSNSSYPIHLITYKTDEDVFLLLETTGGSNILHRYLTTENDKYDIRVKEEDVLDRIDLQQAIGICISDSPGAGKTKCLQNLARVAATKYPDDIVTFHRFESLANLLDKHPSISVSSALARLISPNTVIAIILKEIWNFEKVYFRLFIDAFDEISVNQISTTTAFLKRLAAQSSHVKLYLTSRTHVRGELERTLGVLAYDIDPFSYNNQVSFLTTLWKSCCSTASIEKLEHFARTAIETISKQINSTEKCVTGVPLQCKLIAEVLADDAETYSHPQRQHKIHQDIFLESLFDLYTRYFQLKLLTTTCKLQCVPTEKSMTKSCYACKNQFNIYRFHVLSAVKELLPNIGNGIFIEKFDIAPVNEVLQRGILEYVVSGSTEQLRFLHRTFAEYLAAQFYENIFTNVATDSFQSIATGFELQWYFWKIFNLRDGIVYFLNTSLSFRISMNLQRYPKGKPALFSDDPDMFCRMFFECLQLNYVGLIQLMLSEATEYDSWTKHWISRDLHVEGSRILCMLARNYEPSTVSCLFAWLNCALGLDLNRGVFYTKGVLDTPIDVAIKCSNIDAVKFFLEKPHSSGRLFRICATRSYFLNGPLLQKRLKVGKMILCRLQDDSCMADCSWLLNSWVHKEFLLLLIKHNKGIKIARRKSVFSVISNSAEEAGFLHYRVLPTLVACLIFITSSEFYESGSAWNFVKRLHTALLRYYFIYVGTSTIVWNILLDWSQNTYGYLLNCENYEFYGRKRTYLTCFFQPKVNLELLHYFVLPESSSSSAAITVTDRVKVFFPHKTLAIPVPSVTQNKETMFAIDSEGNTLLHRLAMFGEVSDFVTILTAILQHWCSQARYCDEARNLSNVKPKDLKTSYINNMIRDLFNSQNYKDDTPFHYFIQYTDVIKKDVNWLLMCGTTGECAINSLFVDINKTNKYGMAAVHFAILSEKSLETIEHLFSLGADLHIKDARAQNLAQFSLTYLSSFSCERNMYLMQVAVKVLELGVDPNDLNYCGSNTLQHLLTIAAEEKIYHFCKDYLLDVVHCCICNGVDLSHKNLHGDTAFSIAKREQYDEEVLKLLEITISPNRIQTMFKYNTLRFRIKFQAIICGCYIIYRFTACYFRKLNISYLWQTAACLFGELLWYRCNAYNTPQFRLHL